MSIEAKRRIQTKDRGVLLQLVQLRRRRPGRQQPPFLFGGRKDHPRALFLPCESYVYPAGI